MVLRTVPAVASMSEDALKFMREHQLVEHVDRAVQTVLEVFAAADAIVVSLKKDPEYSDFYVNINASIPDGDPDLEAQKYSDCLANWASFMPPNALGMISLSTSSVM